MSDKSYEWDRYFMTMAYLVSMKSKDPSTKVGAVIVGPDKEIRSTGYNGFPRGVIDLPERYADKEFKFFVGNHAEENAILHCARVGTPTLECTLYSTWIPCSYCSKSIIQAGISTVVYHEDFPGTNGSERWSKSIELSKIIFAEAGVAIRPFSGKMLRISGLYNGNEFEV